MVGDDDGAGDLADVAVFGWVLGGGGGGADGCESAARATRRESARAQLGVSVWRARVQVLADARGRGAPVSSGWVVPCALRAREKMPGGWGVRARARRESAPSPHPTQGVVRRLDVALRAPRARALSTPRQPTRPRATACSRDHGLAVANGFREWRARAQEGRELRVSGEGGGAARALVPLSRAPAPLLSKRTHSRPRCRSRAPWLASVRSVAAGRELLLLLLGARVRLRSSDGTGGCRVVCAALRCVRETGRVCVCVSARLL